MILHDSAPGEGRHRGNGDAGLTRAAAGNDASVANEQAVDVVGLKPLIDHRVAAALNWFGGDVNE